MISLRTCQERCGSRGLLGMALRRMRERLGDDHQEAEEQADKLDGRDRGCDEGRATPRPHEVVRELNSKWARIRRRARCSLRGRPAEAGSGGVGD